MKKLILLFLILILSNANTSLAQELNCQVEINTQQIAATVNKQIFDQMQRAIFEFMNNTKWTNEVYATQEKVECSILIIVKENLGNDEYNGTIQVAVRRPVFKSGYYTQIFNMEDEDFHFKFQQFSQLEFNMNVFQSNLTSILQFYAYVVLATDNDSFAPLGGTQNWQKAQIVVNNSQNSGEAGWKNPNTGLAQKNRYWLVENTLQPIFKGIRDCMYQYCREGLDRMHENPEEARSNILKALELLKPVAASRPASNVMQAFFNAKRDEIINIFKGANPEEKTKVLEILQAVDPAGTTRYTKIQGS